MPWNLRTPSRRWRDLTALAAMPVASGRILLQRDGHRRTLALDQLRIETAGSGNLLVLPEISDRPAFTQAQPVFGITSRIQITSPGNVQAYSWSAGGLIIGQVSWSTEEVG